MKEVRNKQGGWIWGAALAGTALAAAALWQGLTVRRYVLETDKLTAPVRLALLSDFHGARYGQGQSRLLAAVDRLEPDAVVMPGDFYDENHTDNSTDALLSALARRHSCFFVRGNHEWRTGRSDQLREKLEGWGIRVLAGTGELLQVRGQTLRVCGVDDPDLCGERGWLEQFQACQALTGDGTYSLLLSHRPELTQYYRASGFDLVLAGHAHGGQVRIPGVLNGLAAPHQGFFPDYAGGRYRLSGTELIVGRGLSRDLRVRVFNPPELVVVELTPNKENDSNGSGASGR